MTMTLGASARPTTPPPSPRALRELDARKGNAPVSSQDRNHRTSSPGHAPPQGIWPTASVGRIATACEAT